MSKGGSQTSSTSIDPQIKAAFLENVEQARGVAGALPVQSFAGFNPLYTTGEEQLVNTAVSGPGIGSTDFAAQIAAQGALTQPGQTRAQDLAESTANASVNQQLAQQMTGAGGFFQPAELQAAQANLGMGGPGSIGSYMNPFASTVRQNALADLESARRAAIQQTGERATQAKAFGGSRQAVAEGITNLGFAKQAANLGATLNEQAFNQAAQLQQADLARQQQAAAANQQIGLQGAQFRLGAAGQLGSLSAQEQAQRLAASGQLSSQIGQQQAQRLAAANQLGGLGAQQQALRLGGAQALMGAGGARQAFEQQQLDAMRNIGLQRLGISQSALSMQPANLGMTATTPLNRNVGASALGGALAGSQLAGLTGNAISGGEGAALGALLGLF